jgi:uncharacterized membrane protein
VLCSGKRVGVVSLVVSLIIAVVAVHPVLGGGVHSNSNVVTSHRSFSMRDLVARCLMPLVMPHHHALFLLLISHHPHEL